MTFTLTCLGFVDSAAVPPHCTCDGADVESAARPHVLAEALFVGTYAR